MPLAGLILLASLGPVPGARAQSRTNANVVPVAALAAAEVGAVGAVRGPSPGTQSASLLLSNPLIGRSSLSSRAASWRPAPGFATRAVLGRLGSSLASSAAEGRAAAAEPIARAMDGSERRADQLRDDTAVARDVVVPRPSGLAPAIDEAPAPVVQEPPAPLAPKPWKQKAKKGATIGAGWILLALGAVLWILPIPGPTGLLLGGLALLSRHYAWAAVAQARVIAYSLAFTAWVLVRLRLRNRE